MADRILYGNENKLEQSTIAQRPTSLKTATEELFAAGISPAVQQPIIADQKYSFTSVKFAPAPTNLMGSLTGMSFDKANAGSPMGAYRANVLDQVSSALPTGSTGVANIARYVFEEYGFNEFNDYINTRARWKKNSYMTDIMALPSGKEVLAAMPDIVDELKNNGFNISQFMSTEDTVRAVSNAWNGMRAQQSMTSWLDDPGSNAAALLTVMAGDPVNIFEVGGGTVINFGIRKALEASTKGFANRALNAGMKSSIFSKAIKGAASTGLSALDSVGSSLSLIPNAERSLGNRLLTSSLFNAEQTVVQGMWHQSEQESVYGKEYDNITIALETAGAGVGTAVLGTMLHGAFVGAKKLKGATNPTKDITPKERIDSEVLRNAGHPTPPKWMLPESGGPDELAAVSVRASMAEEIAYQLNRLVKNPYYAAQKVLNQDWWDTNVASKIDQSLFMTYLKSNPTQDEIDTFINTVELLAKPKDQLKDNVENLWADWLRKELQIKGIAVRTALDVDQKKNLVWFMANVRDMILKGDPSTRTFTLPDGSVVKTIDPKELEDQILALTALITSRAGKLGMSADEYVFRTFGDFIFDPLEADISGKVMHQMVQEGAYGGWSKIEKINLNSMPSDPTASPENGWGMYLVVGSDDVPSKFAGTPISNRQGKANPSLPLGRGDSHIVNIKFDSDLESIRFETHFSEHTFDVQDSYINSVVDAINRKIEKSDEIIDGVPTANTRIDKELITEFAKRYAIQNNLTGREMYVSLARILSTNPNELNNIAALSRQGDKQGLFDALSRLLFVDQSKNATAKISGLTTEKMKETSELLRKHGIFGMSYKSDVSDKTARNIVAWDESKLDVSTVLFSKDLSGKVRGAVAFNTDGRAIVYGFKNSTDIIALSHEIGHIFRRQLTKEQLANLAKWAGVDPRDPENWSIEAEEKFARAWEKYLATGLAPHKGLERVFSNYNRWMLELYKSFKNSPLNEKLPIEIQRQFDDMLRPKFTPKVRNQYFESLLIEDTGATVRAGQVNLIIEDPSDRLLLQFMVTNDAAERALLLQELRDTMNIPDAEILYHANALYKEVEKKVAQAKRKLRQALPGEPKKMTIKDYEEKFKNTGWSKKVIRLSSRIFAKYDSSAMEWFVGNVYDEFANIANKMKLKISPEAKSKLWVYSETAGHLFDDRNPFTTPELINEMIDIQLGKLALNDPKATREALIKAGQKVRTDSTLVPDVVSKVNLRPDKDTNFLDFVARNQRLETTAAPSVDVRVTAIKVQAPTDSQLEKFVADIIDPKNPTTAYTRAFDEVTSARAEREALSRGGDINAIKENSIRLRRALRNLRRLHNTKYIPAVKGVTPAKVVQEIEFGVVEKAPGMRLTAEEATTVFTNASEQGLFGSGKENWLVYAANKSLRKLRKLGNVFDAGSLATVGSEIPIIARLSHLISSHNLYTDSFGFSRLVGPGLEQRKKRVVSQISKIITDLFDDTRNLDDSTKQLLMYHAMAKINNVSVTPITDPHLLKIVDTMAARIERVYKEYEQRGLSSGYFRGTLDSYSGTFTIRMDKRNLAGLTDAFFAYWSKKFQDPSAELHRKTLYEMPGWYKYDNATGQYVPDSIATRYATLPEKLSDLNATDQAEYLKRLTSTDTNANGEFLYGLKAEAQKAAKNKLGLIDHSNDLALVKANAALTRALEVDIWFSPELREFVDWRIGEGLSSYATNTAYRISEKEGINHFIQSLIGVNRRDFDAVSTLEGIKSTLLANPDLDDASRSQITMSFDYLRNQVMALRESFVSDLSRKQGITDDLVTIMGSLTRVPVSARSPLAGMVTELPMLLMSVLLKDGASGLSRIVRDVLRGATNDQLKGIMAGFMWMRNHMPYTLSTIADSTHINRNWLDKVWTNPTRAIAGATTGMDRAKAVAAWLHHASSGLSGEDLFQGWVSGIAVHAASVRLVRSMDKMIKLTQMLEKHDWTKEADPEKAFRSYARAAGFGDDAQYAARLNQAGLLNSQVLNTILDLDKAVSGRLIDKDNGAFDHGLLEELLIKRPQDREVIERIIAFKETELSRNVTTAGVQDVNIPLGGIDPATKLKNMFTGFARSWFNNIMLNNLGNEKFAYAFFLLSVGLIGEALYNTALRTLYHGESLEDVLQEWEENPVSSTTFAIGRSNVFGTANILPMIVVDMFSKGNGATSQASSLYPVSTTLKMLRASANIIKDGLSSDKEITEKDADTIEAFIPVVNSYWYKSLSEAAGWRGPVNWIFGVQPKEERVPAN